MINHRGGPGVGGAQHRPLQLQAAQARYLQVLVDGDGLAEPADVAQVDDRIVGDRAGSASARQLFAEQVFASRCWAPRVRLPRPNDGGTGTPRLKSPSGMFSRLVNQRNSGGMNSPNGTRWCLS
ncbi:MAG: hypothetical protein IPH51_17935 [Rubrivivax sp.]|nr:hypothetical protein [Rubrivivax sp.]